MLLKLNKVCYFWAAMDVLYIVRFIWLNIEQGRIPLVDDFISFSQIYSEHGVSSIIMFSLSMLLNISFIVSAVLLFIKWNKVSFFIYAQTPLRLLFVLPSLSFIPWVLKNLSITNIFVFISVVVISEVIKVLSFIAAKRNI